MKLAFLCVANSARSQMAEGIARQLYGNVTQVVSAGSAPSRVNPLAIEALRDIGIDISSHTSKSTTDVDLSRADVIVTLCADEVCPIVPPNVKRLHWPFPDPARPDLSVDEQRRLFRDVRDQIRSKLQTAAAELGLISALVAQRQLDAYNRRDLEAFVACYAEDVEVRNLGANDLLFSGRDHLRQRYGQMFDTSPQLHCELVQRLVMGPFVFDEERVTGHSGGDGVLRVVAAYEISGDLIAKVWFARS